MLARRPGDRVFMVTNLRETPNRPVGQSKNSCFPLPDHPAWLAFMDGRLAGITHGIGLGRTQVDQEHADAATFPHQGFEPRAMKRPDGRPMDCRVPSGSHAKVERAAARAEYSGPGLSAEQIRENAFRSWGLIDLDRWNAA
jgi:hypothetical protein